MIRPSLHWPLFWRALARPPGGVLRPAGWSPLEYSEDLMPSLVGLGC